MSGAFGAIAMLKLRGAEPAENLRMRIARDGEAGLNIGAEPVSNARQWHAVHVGRVGVERDPVLLVRQLLRERGQTQLTRRLAAQCVIQRLAAQTAQRK